MAFIRFYTLEIIVFITGASVMILELTGSRIVAPYFGTSIFVWTGLIGVILGSLSIGYWWGGKISVREANFKTFSSILFGGALLIALASFLSPIVLMFMQKAVLDIRIGSVLAATLLFAPPSVLLSMISPYAVRLKMKDVEHSGTTVGNLYALSTVGSIIGTFLAGFFLIPLLGSAKILFFTSALLMSASFLGYSKNVSSVKIGIFLYLIFSIFAFDKVRLFFSSQTIVDIDTAYNRVFIFESIEPATKRPIRVMSTHFPQWESAMFLDQDDDLAVEYLKFFRIAGHFNPGLDSALLIGGAGFSYPKDFLKKNPNASMDVVEIDPGLTELAKKYFGLEKNPRLAIYHEDGRTFLNRGGKKYDAILIDAFKAVQSVPYQLTTAEAVKKMYEMLTDNGVLLLNVISSIEGDKGKFFRAEYWTVKSIFANVYVITVADANDGNTVQNLLLVALKNKKEPMFKSEIPEFNGYLSHLWKKEILHNIPILTDDFAPVDNYITLQN